MPAFEKMYGDKWAGKINYTSGYFGLNYDSGRYLQLPTFSEEIARVEVTVASISGTRSIFLTDSSTGQIGSAYQSVSASETGTYTLDVSLLAPWASVKWRSSPRTTAV